MTPEQKKRAREFADSNYPNYLHPEKNAGVIVGYAKAIETEGLTGAPKLEDQNLERRADRLVELAMKAAKAKPENLPAIMHELIAQTVTDFETAFQVDERVNEKGDMVHTYRRVKSRWNPPMGSGR